METTKLNVLDVSSDTTTSGVSWSAIFAGASAAAALSLILLILGVGLGFSAISPWSNSGVSAPPRTIFFYLEEMHENR